MTIPMEPVKQQIIKPLSMEVAGIPENEQCMIYTHFDAAIAEGIIIAVQHQSQMFETTYVALNGETITEKRAEEYIEINDAWSKWLAEQRLASKYHVMKLRKEYQITDTMLHENTDVFDVMAAMRRNDLIKQRQAEDKRRNKPAVKGKTKVRTSSKTRKPVPSKKGGTSD